jgi:hypothetical protein
VFWLRFWFVFWFVFWLRFWFVFWLRFWFVFWLRFWLMFWLGHKIEKVRKYKSLLNLVQNLSKLNQNLAY